MKILRQMMNPSVVEKPELIEYDCVFQLKNLVKRYYIRKGQITEGLLKKLDAIVMERPSNLQKKKDYFLESTVRQAGSKEIREEVSASDLYSLTSPKSPHSPAAFQRSLSVQPQQ